MSITKEIIADKIEVTEIGRIQIRTATVIKENGIELTRTFHRHSIDPCDKSSGTWQDTDISSEDERVQAIANATWTDEVKTAYQQMKDSEKPAGE